MKDKIKQRLLELSKTLKLLSEMPPETPNFNIEMKTCLGALIKSLEIQMSKLNETEN